jgi:hypothetical protein
MSLLEYNAWRLFDTDAQFFVMQTMLRINFIQHERHEVIPSPCCSVIMSQNKDVLRTFWSSQVLSHSERSEESTSNVDASLHCVLFRMTVHCWFNSYPASSVVFNTT